MDGHAPILRIYAMETKGTWRRDRRRLQSPRSDFVTSGRRRPMPQIDTGDTAWVLMCAALVMFMTPGLALFYGGLVRTKNVLGTIMQSFFALALVTVLWTLIGYTLAFGRDVGGVIGGLSFLGLNDVGLEPSETYGTTVPHLAFSTYQLMFAIITPALITGAVAERMRFSAYALFLGLWSILVYAPVAHWVFADGWLGLSGVGALDFAGGTVVHINAGAAALAAIVFLGKRRGFGRQAFIPHDVPMVILGASILWFGWFGFNAGSGLVAITPAAGFVEPWAAIVIGFAAGAVCFFVVNLKARIGYDDSLDVVGVHLVGGIVGALFTGVFASAAVNGFSGGLVQLGRQALAVGATMAFSFAMTLGILKVVDMLVGVRVSEEEELTGLDLSQHSEVAYTSSEGSGALAGQQDTVIAVPETPTPAVPAYRET